MDAHARLRYRQRQNGENQVSFSVVTYKSFGARAVVAGHAVNTGASVLARAGPALVPVGLTLHARVPVDTVTGVRAVAIIIINFNFFNLYENPFHN